MTQKEIWTPYQDEALRKVVAALEKPINWKVVLKELNTTYKISKKNCKECRKRWCDLENLNQNLFDWTQQQEQLLLKKQQEMGNKWLQLARFFPNRCEGFLKNQFYSIFRRALRRANKQIYIHKGNSVRPITSAIVLKILAVCEQKFDKKNIFSKESIDAAQKLKFILIQYSNPIEEEKQNQTKVNVFIEAINDFRKEFKSKPPQIKKEEPQNQLEHRSLSRLYINNKRKKQVPITHSFQLFQPVYQKQLQRSSKTLHSPPPLLLPQICLFQAPIVEMGEVIEQQIYHLPVTSIFETIPNKFLTLIKPINLSLQESMLFYENYCRRPEGMESSFLINSNSNIRFPNL